MNNRINMKTCVIAGACLILGLGTVMTLPLHKDNDTASDAVFTDATAMIAMENELVTLEESSTAEAEIILDSTEVSEEPSTQTVEKPRRKSHAPQTAASLPAVTTQLTDSDIYAKLSELQAIYPAGMYWNNTIDSDEYGVSDIPCDHSDGDWFCNLYIGATDVMFPNETYPGTQCLGFASMLSDEIFGADAPVYRVYNFDDVRLGDQIRTENDNHSCLIIEKGADYIVVAECNANYNDCAINWGRTITLSELNATNTWYFSRY